MAPCRPGAADGRGRGERLQDGQHERGRLARAGGRAGEHVAAREHVGDDLRLDGRRHRVPLGDERVDHVAREAQRPRKGEASMAAGSTATAGGASSCAPGREASEADGSKGRLDWACEWRLERRGRNDLTKEKRTLSRQPLRTCAGRNQRTIPRYRAIGKGATGPASVASRETPSSRILHASGGPHEHRGSPGTRECAL